MTETETDWKAKCLVLEEEMRGLLDRIQDLESDLEMMKRDTENVASIQRMREEGWANRGRFGASGGEK